MYDVISSGKKLLVEFHSPTVAQAVQVPARSVSIEYQYLLKNITSLKLDD